MTTMVAKIGDRVVQVMRVADTVGFSTERGWLLFNRRTEPLSAWDDWFHGTLYM
jgi:hypothetical protein